MGGPRQRGWAPIGLPSCLLSGLLGRMGGPPPLFMFPFCAPGSDGWAAATGLGSHWAPFMFPFWAPGSDGWAAATGLGSHWAPFMFPFWAGRMGGPRQRGWASIELPSFGWVGSHWAPFMFPFWAPGSDGWAAATGLGSHWAPFMFTLWAGRMGGPRQRGWASIELPSCFLSGLLGRMGDGAGLPLGSLHVSFLGSWVGWVGRGNGAGLPLGSLHVSFRMGGPRQRAGVPLGSLHVSFLGSLVGWVTAPIGLPSCFLSRLLGRMGGPRQRGWTPIGLPSCFLSDGWATATGLGAHWAPFMFPFWASGSDAWAAATGLGSH